MPLGAGLCPAGVAPAGYGVPDTVGPPNAVTLPHPKTGQPMGGRAINASTGDYVFMSDGRIQGMSNVQQLVLLAIRTLLGTSVATDLGIDLTGLQEKGPDFQRKLSTVIAKAFKPLVDQKFVRLDRVSVLSTPNPDGAFAAIEWFDLTTLTPQTTTL